MTHNGVQTERGTYAEIRNKLHCSAGGRIAQNPLTGPLSPPDGCPQEEGCTTSTVALFYLPTYAPTPAPPFPSTQHLSSFYQRSIPVYDLLPPPVSLPLVLRPFGYNPRPLSISHCHTSSNPFTSRSHFVLFFLSPDLSFFRALHI